MSPGQLARMDRLPRGKSVSGSSRSWGIQLMRSSVMAALTEK